ncbi:hypothetical protein C8R44DRAFT_887905 [Mycena epipterygia]|nr:hypothetical protein C8R44DRAFT_887905 [Mycena epipterygia]
MAAGISSPGPSHVPLRPIDLAFQRHRRESAPAPLVPPPNHRSCARIDGRAEAHLHTPASISIFPSSPSARRLHLHFTDRRRSSSVCPFHHAALSSPCSLRRSRRAHMAAHLRRRRREAGVRGAWRMRAPCPRSREGDYTVESETALRGGRNMRACYWHEKNALGAGAGGVGTDRLPARHLPRSPAFTPIHSINARASLSLSHSQLVSTDSRGLLAYTCTRCIAAPPFLHLWVPMATPAPPFARVVRNRWINISASGAAISRPRRRDPCILWTAIDLHSIKPFP